MSSIVAPPRAQNRKTNRRKVSKKPFQTEIKSQRVHIRGVGKLPVRSGIFIEARDTPGFKEDGEIVIPVQYRGEPAVVLISTNRVRFPVQIESCPLRDSTKFAVFAHGILLDLAESHKGKKAFRLVSQHANASNGVNGKRCTYAKFLHTHSGRKNGVTKLTLSRKGN